MIINAQSGGIFAAYITVTYPGGSCTCTLGSDSYTHTGGGTTTFEVGKKGAWIVKATSPSATVTKTQAVTVSANNEIKTLSINYTTDLFKSGTTDNLAGGWTGWKLAVLGEHYQPYAAAASVSVGSTIHASISSAYGSQGGFRCHNLINLTDFKTLTFVLTGNVSDTTNAPGNTVGAFPSNATYRGQAAASVNVASGKTGTITVDISNVNGSYYVGGSLSGYGTASSITISQITLS